MNHYREDLRLAQFLEIYKNLEILRFFSRVFSRGETRGNISRLPDSSKITMVVVDMIMRTLSMKFMMMNKMMMLLMMKKKK